MPSFPSWNHHLSACSTDTITISLVPTTTAEIHKLVHSSRRRYRHSYLMHSFCSAPIIYIYIYINDFWSVRKHGFWVSRSSRRRSRLPDLDPYHKPSSLLWHFCLPSELFWSRGKWAHCRRLRHARTRLSISVSRRLSKYAVNHRKEGEERVVDLHF